jgi:hypothetical protein
MNALNAPTVMTMTKILVMFFLLVGLVVFVIWANVAAFKKKLSIKTAQAKGKPLDMQRCTLCGNFVAVNAKRCMRSGCPC